jgi:hypothetical protein
MSNNTSVTRRRFLLIGTATAASAALANGLAFAESPKKEFASRLIDFSLLSPEETRLLSRPSAAVVLKSPIIAQRLSRNSAVGAKS